MNNNQTTQAELLPCPFCGNQPFVEAKFLHGKMAAIIRCEECRAVALDEVWNTRTDTHLQARLKQADLLVRALKHALNNMNRDTQATMSDPTYEETLEIIANYQANKEGD